MNYEHVDELLDELVKAIRSTIVEEDINKYYKLADELKELKKTHGDLRRRTNGMSSMLQRIRVKCDVATGVDHDKDYDEQGRAIGAEGAVDRLLAFSLGKVFIKSKAHRYEAMDLHERIQEMEQLLGARYEDLMNAIPKEEPDDTDTGD